MRVYGVVYASLFDENNMFTREEDAKRFKRMLCRRHKLKFNDPMLRILTIDVHEFYDSNLYRPKKVKAEKPTEAETPEAEKTP